MKKAVIILSIFSLCSCKQEKTTVISNNKDSIIDLNANFSILTNLKKLKDKKKIKINDSLQKISGEFEIYKITGYLNQYDQKINWWNIVNNVDAHGDNVRVQFKIIDKKEYVNQYIFYTSRDGDYKINSLFYLKDSLNKDLVKYKFYTPNKKNKKNWSASFYANIYVGEELISTADLKCKRNDEYYYVDLNIPIKNKVSITGLFEEVYEYEDGEMGVNDIYIDDNIK